MGRCSKSNKEDRIRRVMDLLGEGRMTYDIVNICQKEWGCGRRAIEKYIQHIYTFLNKSLQEKDKDKILLEYSNLIEKYEKIDKRLARDYRLQRDKILGISIDRVDHSGTIDVTGIEINIKR